LTKGSARTEINMLRQYPFGLSLSKGGGYETINC
jgi:hypothetical protein